MNSISMDISEITILEVDILFTHTTRSLRIPIRLIAPIMLKMYSPLGSILQHRALFPLIYPSNMRD